MEINLENRGKIIALLEQGICPICGKGPFKVPLLHITQAHGIPQNKLKDALMISHIKGFSEKELHDKRSKEAKERQAAGTLHPNLGKDRKHTEKTKGKQAFTAKTKGNPNATEAVKKARSKAVCRISDTGEVDKIYNSITDAAKDNNIRISSIARAERENMQPLAVTAGNSKISSSLHLSPGTVGRRGRWN